MDALETIGQRRSVRRFNPVPLPGDILRRVVEAAAEAPHGGSPKGRHFLVVTQRDTLAQLAALHPQYRWLREAGAALVVLARPSLSRHWFEDCAVAGENAWLAATAFGLGAAWASVYQPGNEEETARWEVQVRRLLAIPDDWRVPLVLGLGYPEAAPAPRWQPELKDLVHWERFGGSSPD